MRRFLISLMSVAYAPTVHANEPATIVAVEGLVTLHGQSATSKRAASRGARLDKASVVSIPKGAMVRLRFNDLRGTEYSLPSGIFTLDQARRLAQSGRASTFDRVRSFLHVTMGDQVSPLDAAAYLPNYTRTDTPTMNVIWPQEWFGTGKAVLRYSHGGQASENRVENVGPVVEVPAAPGVTMWVLEGYGAKPALARGFIQRDMQKPADLATEMANAPTGERVLAAHEAGYHRDAIRLLREERKQDLQPDFVFESALAPRLPASLVASFLNAVGSVSIASSRCKAAPHFIVIDDDFIGVVEQSAVIFKYDLSPDVTVFALNTTGNDSTVWNGVNTLAGGLAAEPEGAATAILARLWISSNGNEKAELNRIGARVEKLPAHDCLRAT